PGERADHPHDDRAARHPRGAGRHQPRPLRQHLGGVDSARAARRARPGTSARGRRPRAPRRRRRHDGGRDRRAVVGRGAPRHRGVAAALLLVVLVAAAFADVLLGGRTLSPAPFVPGVTPSGPYDAPPPSPTALRDLEGGAWVDEPAPYLVHRALADGRLPLWNDGVGLGAPLA